MLYELVEYQNITTHLFRYYSIVYNYKLNIINQNEPTLPRQSIADQKSTPKHKMTLQKSKPSVVIAYLLISS